MTELPPGSTIGILGGGQLGRMLAVAASRLGYRITARFTSRYFGRVFLHPHSVFTDDMLRPELQDLGVYVDGVANIVATHQRVAESYFADGTIALACPPLKALLEIMAHGRTAGSQGPLLPGERRRMIFRIEDAACAAARRRTGSLWF